MKLFLIRHGETVDNVAGLYAGSRDSQLTNHGVAQIARLGEYLARNGVRFTHIFASPLTRALKTAEAVRKEQPAPLDGSGERTLEVIKAVELMERDFGFYEGKPFHARNDEAQNERNKALPGFVDVESVESMTKRIDSFLDEQLLPLLDFDMPDQELVVAVVAHGMLLSNFWRRLLLRLPRKSLTIAPEITAKRDGLVLEYIGGWSNTGYMELAFTRHGEPGIAAVEPAQDMREDSAVDGAATLPTPVPPSLEPHDAGVSIAPTRNDEPAVKGNTPRILSEWSTTVLAIDSTLHLIGLKRQRGGIGSLAHDEGQRKLESFFKKPKMS